MSPKDLPVACLQHLAGPIVERAVPQLISLYQLLQQCFNTPRQILHLGRALKQAACTSWLSQHGFHILRFSQCSAQG